MAFPQKVKTELLYDTAISIYPKYMDIYPKELKAGSQRDICTLMFIAALLTTAKMWKQPRYPLTDERISKMSYIHTMEYCSVLKGKEILTPATIWMNLEDIVLSEITQSQKDKYCVILLI